MVRRVLAVALLVLAAVGRARGVCPADPTFGTLACGLGEARGAAACVAGRARPAVRRALAAIGRRTGAAQRATGQALAHLAALRLQQASGRVDALRARLSELDGRGRLPAGCAAALDEPLGQLASVIAAMLAGPSTTTTTTASIPSTTTTTTSTVPSTTTTTTLPNCGNGRLDPGEQCDGTNLFGRDCATLGFTGGTLACRPDCLFDTSHCTF
jgi:hypothetical protein